MARGRAWVVPAAMLVFAMAGASTTSGQDKPPDELKLKKPEMAQYQALTALVDAVVAGKEPAPADVKLKFQQHFVKSVTNVFVPYLVEVSGGKFSSFPVGVYVRAVRKAGATTADKPTAADKPSSPAFSDVYFLADAKQLRSAGADTVEFSRGLELPPGEFDLYVAMAEMPPRNAKTASKRVVHTQTLSVPDFSGALTTSSVVVAKSLEDAPPKLTAEQQLEEPFTFGGYRITPTFTSTFSKADELLFAFFIYNEGAGASGKPDVDVSYLFFRAAEAKPFSKAATTVFNETTLPAEFSLSAGHQLVVGQGIPLASFAPGEYRLEIRIADKTNSQAITRNVPFTMAP